MSRRKRQKWTPGTLFHKIDNEGGIGDAIHYFGIPLDGVPDIGDVEFDRRWVAAAAAYMDLQDYVYDDLDFAAQKEDEEDE